MRARIAAAGLGAEVVVESAGTGAWHVGEPSDRRAILEARRRGIAMDGRARQFTAADFARFDLVLAMDRRNAADLRRMAPTREDAAKVRLLREFDPAAGGDLDVPDPYFGGADGFEDVFDMVERACAGPWAGSRRGPDDRRAGGGGRGGGRRARAVGRARRGR